MTGAIFDIDGTILDSMTMWLDVTQNFLSQFDVHLTQKECEIFQDMTLEESLPQIKEEYNIGMSVEEIHHTFKNMVIDSYKNTVSQKPFAVEYIKKLHSQGVKIAVATSGYEGAWQLAFKRLGIFDYIDAAAYSFEVGVNKSNPDIYLLAAKRIGMLPKDCTVFEDIPVGISGAKKGGFKTCGVWDISNDNQTEELKQLSDLYIKDFSELL